ncbi:hypothetical protein D3C73_703280 [compost metagenome]
MQIGRRIYFDNTSGNVVLDTGERSGSVIETTIEQDFLTYFALSERLPETVGHIQLGYGQYAQDFIESNGVWVNPATLELEFSYPGPSDPTEPVEPEFRKPITQEVDELKEENLNLMVAITELYELVLGGS